MAYMAERGNINQMLKYSCLKQQKDSPDLHFLKQRLLSPTHATPPHHPPHPSANTPLSNCLGREIQKIWGLYMVWRVVVERNSNLELAALAQLRTNITNSTMTQRHGQYASCESIFKSIRDQSSRTCIFFAYFPPYHFSQFQTKEQRSYRHGTNITLLTISHQPKNAPNEWFALSIRILSESDPECKDDNHPQIELQLLMTEHQFNLEDSQADLLPADWLPRQKSNDSIFNELIRAPVYGERPLLFTLPPSIDHEQNLPKVFKSKEKKRKVKKPCDYRKNICGYITKKIIREYISTAYKPKVDMLCHKHGCDYSASKSYFLSKIERVTGPSHVPSLFVAAEPWERPIKAAFREFFIWFTKERYLRYLILEGKMEQKEAYIEYKNTVLMALVNKSQQLDRQHLPSVHTEQDHSP